MTLTNDDRKLLRAKQEQNELWRKLKIVEAKFEKAEAEYEANPTSETYERYAELDNELAELAINFHHS